jgi:hypothetical protein
MASESERVDAFREGFGGLAAVVRARRHLPGPRAAARRNRNANIGPAVAHA